MGWLKSLGLAGLAILLVPEAAWAWGPGMHILVGTELLGALYVPGIAPRLVLYFLAHGPAECELQFDIRSVVEKKKRWSLVRADDKEKQVGLRIALPPRLWRAGFIYTSTSEIRHRPGQERFYGFWFSRDGGSVPEPERGPRRVTLLRLP